MLEEHSHIKDALSRIVVEIAKREWPQQWISMIDELDALCCCGVSFHFTLLFILLWCSFNKRNVLDVFFCVQFHWKSWLMGIINWPTSCELRQYTGDVLYLKFYSVPVNMVNVEVFGYYKMVLKIMEVCGEMRIRFQGSIHDVHFGWKGREIFPSHEGKNSYQSDNDPHPWELLKNNHTCGNFCFMFCWSLYCFWRDIPRELVELWRYKSLALKMSLSRNYAVCHDWCSVIVLNRKKLQYLTAVSVWLGCNLFRDTSNGYIIVEALCTNQFSSSRGHFHLIDYAGKFLFRYFDIIQTLIVMCLLL